MNEGTGTDEIKPIIEDGRAQGHDAIDSLSPEEASRAIAEFQAVYEREKPADSE